MSTESFFIGVDVASAHLDICRHGHSAVRRLPNTLASIDSWLATLPAATQLAMESTGRYHQLLAQRAHAAGLRVYVLNPRDVRAYANGLGQRGKTDRLDAQVLARYIAHEHAELRAWQPLPEHVQQLQELLCRRAGVVKQQQALRMSLADLPQLAPALRALDSAMVAVLKSIDTLLGKALKAAPHLQGALRSVLSVPGIGPLNAAALLSVFERLSSRGADAVIAFLGMDLRPRDSGNSTGKRRMTKRGQPEFRRLLFNGARSASRTNAWRPYYERELAKGLSPTQATNALARRLVRVAFALFKSGQAFDTALLAIHRA
jgi:transposase